MTRIALALLGLFIVGLTVVATPVVAEDVAACRAQPTVTCLADLGYAAAMEASEMPRVDQSAELMATIGRLDDARDIVLRNERLNGSSEAGAEGMADFRLGDFAAIDRLLAGEDPEAVLQDVGDLKFQTALMRLAGLMTSGTNLELRTTKDPARIAVLRRALPAIGSDRSSLISVASLFIEIGEEAEARAVLDRLPVDTSRRSFLPDKVVQLIGTERALEIYQGMGADLPWDWYFRTLAENEPDAARARAFLVQALEHIETLEAEERPVKWRVLIWNAVELGHEGVARDALGRLQRGVTANGEAPADDYLVLAEALLTLSAPEVDVRAALEEAERGLPDLEFDAQRKEATSSLAKFYLGLGDVETALRLFEMAERSRWDWERLVSADAASKARRAVLRAADKALSEDDRLMLRVYLARSLLRDTRSAEERAEGEEMARALFQNAPPRDPVLQGYFYDKLLRAANALASKPLIAAVLDRSIDEALAAGDHRALIQAAHRLHWMANAE